MGTETKVGREVTHGSNGYFGLSENGHPLIQGEVDKDGKAIWVGRDETVTIDKMFGPLVFMPIRVRADFESCEWVIERGDKGAEWREVARVPGQLEEDFAD